MPIDTNLVCNCGGTTWVYFANIQITEGDLEGQDFTKPQGKSSFPIGEIEVEICKTCGKVSELFLPEKDRAPLHN
jgi:hypothetical protein